MGIRDEILVAVTSVTKDRPPNTPEVRGRIQVAVNEVLTRYARKGLLDTASFAHVVPNPNDHNFIDLWFLVGGNRYNIEGLELLLQEQSVLLNLSVEGTCSIEEAAEQEWVAEGCDCESALKQEEHKLLMVYVAGPFSASTPEGIEQNILRAEEVGRQLVHAGFFPVIPHSLGRNFQHDGSYTFWLQGTKQLLCACDAVVMIKNWTASRGAQEEWTAATQKKIPIFYESWNDFIDELKKLKAP